MAWIPCLRPRSNNRLVSDSSRAQATWESVKVAFSAASRKATRRLQSLLAHWSGPADLIVTGISQSGALPHRTLEPTKSRRVVASAHDSVPNIRGLGIHREMADYNTPIGILPECIKKVEFWKIRVLRILHSESW
jgi:hypothetical protein